MEERRKPDFITEIQTHDLGNGIINISSPPMKFQEYLVIGKVKAMLIDTGFGMFSMKEVVEKLTDLPIILVNTHGHPDHVGGNVEFGAPYLHSEDNELYSHASTHDERMEEALGWKFWPGEMVLQPDPLGPVPMQDGDIFDLGERKLEVILTPGHTRGSVCLFDWNTGYLFSGDTVQNTPAALIERYASPVSVYLESLKKLKKYPIKAICPGHRENLIEPDVIDRKIACAEYILAGHTGELKQTRAGEAYSVTLDGATIDFIPKNNC